MRLDRDAINNDALTDPMAGGRPHESHDLTFAWVARARSRPENRSRCDFSARHGVPGNGAISSVTAIATAVTRETRGVPSLSLSLFVIAFSLSTDVSISPVFSSARHLLALRSSVYSWHRYVERCFRV